MSLRHAPSSLLALLLVLALGCGSDGGGDGGTGPEPASLDEVAPSSTTPRTLERVVLTGLPPVTRTTTPYEVEFVGIDVGATMPVEIDGEGVTYFLAPFHPLTPTVGGSVVLRVIAGEARSPEFTLDLAPLDDAPGAFAALTAALATHVDAHAQRRGSSLAELRALSFDDTPALLLPLRYAVSWIDDPANDNDLADVAEGTSDLLSSEERTLLDQICGSTGFTDLVGIEVDAVDELDPPDPGGSNALARRRTCIEAGPAISTASQLSAAMWEAKFAEIAISGDAGNTLAALSGTLAAGAAIPGFGLPFTLAGGTVAAWSASRGALAGLNPSEFVSITASVTKQRFDEDTEVVGRWSDVNVTVRSRGWSADQAVVDAVITALGVYASTAQAAQLTTASFLQDAAVATVNTSASQYVGSREGGLIEFCAQQWTVDVSDPRFSIGRAVMNHFAVLNEAKTYRPTAVEEDFLNIAVRPQMFGQESIDIDYAIGVDAIEVVPSPSQIVLETPGETVDLTVTLRHAEDTSLFWDPGAGEWDDGLLEFTNEPKPRRLKTPQTRDAYPFTVTIESMSRKGLRASGEPSREGFVVVRLDDPIVVTPANACVGNGESESFQALQSDEPASVNWSLEGLGGGPSSFGNVSSAGVYTAPATGTGQVLVVASSTDNPDNRGVAVVDVGSCTCFFALSIGGGGAWSGQFAGHLFPSFAGNFTLAWETPGGAGVGNVQAFVDTPGPNETGVFLPDTFGFQIGSSSWVATGSDVDDGTDITLEIVENDGGTIQGSLYGTALRPVNGEAVFVSYALNFRSANLASGPGCGDD